MPNLDELFLHGSKEQIWKKYCGHLDLSINEFMEIQKRLLLEQFEILQDCELGKTILGKKMPRTIEEFRTKVPLTTYDDYLPFLADKKESTLPKDEYLWARTSGRSGKMLCKWVPYTKRIYNKLGEVVIGAMILSSCRYKGEVNIEPGDVVLLATAPRPYTSGYISFATKDEMSVRFVPSLETGEKMGFSERVSAGFDIAMETGLDYFFGLASILGKIGERFEQGSSNFKFSAKMLKPKIITRLLKGFLNSKLNGRATLPRDIWKLKGVMTGGMDTEIYRDRIEYYWGRKPLEGYASTEGSMVGMQAWNYKGMTFFPDCNFYEFIPFSEHLKSKTDPRYKPTTKLFNELKTGIYELVITNLLGGVLNRYRIGDLLEIISLKDEEIGVDIPQIRFYSRADDLIDLGSMARFNETAIWQAIDKANIPYVDWTARKENIKGEPVLHIYIEFADSKNYSLEKVKSKIRVGLQKVCPEFKDMERMLGDERLLVTQLPPDAFNNYIEAQRQAGADLAHIKPPHMQPKDSVLQKLLNK